MPTAAPYVVATNIDGFAHPEYDGEVGSKYATITYLNISTLPKALFGLPLGAVIVDWKVNVSTAFNGTGTNLLDLGIIGTSQQYAASLNVGITGQITAGFVASQLFGTPLTETVAVQGLYTDGASNSSAGVATVAVFYMLRNLTGRY